MINGTDLVQMVNMGAQYLQANTAQLNALNVFPVPDGDTGTNMSLTMNSGIEELKLSHSTHLGVSAEVLSKGLLMGARGNSGVILSQLFRGFAKSVQHKEYINSSQFADALLSGVEMAYKAVVKPVEGTILTVAKEAAKHALAISKPSIDILHFIQEVLAHSRVALANTTEQLPILKQVGIVDAGGQGLVHIYEGFVAALSGRISDNQQGQQVQGNLNLHPSYEHPSYDMSSVYTHSAQSMFATNTIEFGYCTEFIIKLTSSVDQQVVFDENSFREKLTSFGDSLMVVADDDLVKVHIHAEFPGTVMNHAMQFGELTRIKIENMREQHSHILMNDEPKIKTSAAVAIKVKAYGFVAVAMGAGISAIFSSLGVDVVLAGGQTMNPSTEDLVHAVQQIEAQTIYILPNNSNIILAAQQVKEMLPERQIIIIPSKSIPQGICALVAFEAKATSDVNTEAMIQVLSNVHTGQVTYAVHDSTLEGLTIKKGDYLGILDHQVVISQPQLGETCQQLLDQLIGIGGEMVTIFIGEDAAAEQTDQLQTYLQQTYPHVEIEVHMGNQPLYVYIFSVE